MCAELARRNPTFWLRLPGGFVLRLATRAFCASLSQDPPRTTRLEPSLIRSRPVARLRESGHVVTS